jgi:hypothetical protein
VGGRPTAQHVDMVLELVRRGFADRLLLSHDAGWYEAGKAGGAPEKVRPFTAARGPARASPARGGLGSRSPPQHPRGKPRPRIPHPGASGRSVKRARGDMQRSETRRSHRPASAGTNFAGQLLN